MTISEALARTIIDPKSYAQREIADAAFTQIRAEQPLDKAELPDFDPFWLLFPATRSLGTGGTNHGAATTAPKQDSALQPCPHGTP